MNLRTIYITALLLLLGASSQAQTVWEQTGPLGTTMTTVHALPTGTVLMYQKAGVFRSTDRGVTWERTGFNEVAVSSFGSDSSRSAYAMTEVGLYRSTDDGVTWSTLAFADTAIAAFAATTSHMFVAIRPSATSGTSRHAVYRSSDGGGSWRALDVLQWDDRAVYPSVMSARGAAVVAGDGPFLFRSDDAGSSWRMVYFHPIIIPSACEDAWPRLDFAAALDGGHTLAQWGSIMLFDSAGEQVRNEMRSDVGVMSVDATGALFGAFYYRGIARSIDMGRTWDTLSMEPQFTMQLITAPDNVLYARSATLSRSDDGGASWVTPAPTTRTARVSRLLHFGGNRLYSFGLSTDRGETWQPSSVPGGILARSPGGEFYVWSSTLTGDYEHRLHHSRDGVMWTEERLPNNLRASFHRFFPMDNGLMFGKTGGSDYGCLGYGQGYLYRSVDGGRSWHLAFEDNMGVQTMARAPSGLVYAGMAQQYPSPNGPVGYIDGVYRSSDSGRSWVRFESGMKGIIELHMLGDERVYARADNGLWRSDDSGATWSRVDNGITDVHITALVRNGLGHLFAATATAGVFVSTDDAETWQAFNGGLWYSRVLSLALDSAGVLYAGTDGASMFRTLGTTVNAPIESVGDRYKTLTVRPNVISASGSTTVTITSKAHARVAIIDALGREVMVIHEAENTWTELRQTVDASTLAAGVYRVVSRVGDEVYTEALIVE